MNKGKIFLILIFLILFPLTFLSTENVNFFYEIVSNFYLLSDNLTSNYFVIYYRYYQQAKDRYFIYGYDTMENKSYGFSPYDEFITTKPFLNDDSNSFAYGALYQGNDFVWYKDFKNKQAYKILYSISGKLSLLSLDKNQKNIIVGFDYLDPQKMLYISGVKEYYTYPLTSYPNIIETGFTNDEKYVYIVFKYNNLYSCDILTLSDDPYHSSSYKPPIKKVFNDVNEVIYISSSGIITRENEQIFFYNFKDYSKNKLENFSIIKDKNDEKNAIFIINDKLYNRDFEKINILSENYKIDEKLLINYLKISKKIFYSNDFLMVIDDKNNLYLFQYIKDQKTFKSLVTLTNDIKNFDLIVDNEIFSIQQFEDRLFILIKSSYLSTDSVSILLFKKGEDKIEIIYSDNIFKLEKALNSKYGILFLVKKAYSKGIFQELYYYSFISNLLTKISGWENATDKELNLLKRNIK